MKNIVIDLDGTLTVDSEASYPNKPINTAVLDALKKYKNQGFRIVIFTARNMRTYKGNVGEINIHTLPGIIRWLDENQVPYDEVVVGKPWCGLDGFYVDDKAIRPSEFASMTYEEIKILLANENPNRDSGNK